RAPFTEGTNRLRICAEDFATTGSSNVACSAWRHVTVDNLAPGPPQSLTVTGGAGWRAVNDFELTWRNPAPGATPIAGIRYAIEDADTGEVVQPAKELQRAGVESLSGIRVPRPGHFRVHLR